MDALWAPWRNAYIYRRKRARCIFCVPKRAHAGSDRKRYILERTRHSFAILNTYPYNAGHIMIAPYRHTPHIERLSDAEMLDLFKLTGRVKRILDDVFSPHGYNIGINTGKVAGAGFDKHIHVHVVPRWSGDTNFMPVVGGVKVISDSLDALYDRYRECNVNKT